MKKILYELKKLLKIYIFNKKINVSKEQKKAYIMLSADYGNTGDLAITYAQRKFLEENLEGYKVIEVPIYDFYRKYLSIRKKINSKDVITIIGGGNTGDVYIEFEEVRRFIIKKFKKNIIISFPQTIDFVTTKELQKSIKAYSRNTNLYLFAREKKSYYEYKEKFKVNNVFLVPDIVLSLDTYKTKLRRNNILICLRNDKEKQIDDNDENKLTRTLYNKYNNIVLQDTHIGNKKITYDKREKVLRKIWNNFSSSRVVVTDRLHGLIFSIITETPCIAIDNSNHKIKETYNTWLKENQNVL